jgi:hypothetical protein
MKEKSCLIHGMKPLATTCWLLLSLLGLQAAEITFVAPGFNTFPTGATGWRYRLGTSEASTPSSAWRTNNFVEDGTWSNGAIPIGYASTANDPLGYESKIVTTLPTSTVGNYTAVYLRKTFVVTNRLSISAIQLGLVVDDGAVAWVNGREVMRSSAAPEASTRMFPASIQPPPLPMNRRPAPTPWSMTLPARWWTAQTC